MASKYSDITSVIQVIGCVFNNPSLLDFTDKYTVTEEDFSDSFHRTIFGAIYKIYELGAKKISLENINDFLSSRPKSEAIYKSQEGDKWLLKASDAAIAESFDYYYNRMKKMTLLRAYDNFGIDVSNIYDPDNFLDAKKRQAQEEYLDNSTLEQIADKIDNRIEEIKIKYIHDMEGQFNQAGDGIYDLLAELEHRPEVGIPLYGQYVNTVTAGARLKKLYMRSAPSGTGKTRTLIADACYIACNQIFDDNFGWIKNGIKQPVLYIATEQELKELQTLMLAFLSNVNEDHILKHTYEGDEEERVRKAAEIIADSPLYIREIPDFSLLDIENIIKQSIRDYDVKYVFFDYIHTSMKILEEITRRSGGVKLREDNILFMLSVKLKDLCNMYGIFIETATQLNGDWKDAEIPDQNLLRGAKALADKIDLGCHILPVNSKDKESLEQILSTNLFETPTLKIAYYKNRRGRYKNIYLWCKADLGTCRVQPMFATTYDYEIIEMSDLKIEVTEAAAWEV